MACCAALTIVLAFVRTVWARLLGREPAEDLFPPGATWSSGREMVRPVPVVRPAATGTPIGRPLASTVLAYAMLVHLLAATGLAHVDPSGVSGWALRDAVLATAAIGFLMLARHRTSTAAALMAVGALWFGVGLIDMHALAGFEFTAVPLVLDVTFHLSGWWLAIAAAGIAVVQRRQEAFPIGVQA